MSTQYFEENDFGEDDFKEDASFKLRLLMVAFAVFVLALVAYCIYKSYHGL